ncbi:MAG: class I SAM-dependent methyltransferase [Candidatus Thorarchaeota archaeon]
MDEKLTEERELGVCCADFYNHPLVVALLEGMFHPGGIALTAHLADRMGIDAESQVLDLACGDGTSASYLARTVGCEVWGVDVGTEMIEKAEQNARNLRVEDKTHFIQAIASEIPFEGGKFNAIISECALCTFYDKSSAVSEIHRTLKADGVFGMTDMTVTSRERLGEELGGLFGRVACIADALSSDTYIQLFKEKELTLIETSSQTHLLTEVVERVRRNTSLIGTVDSKLGQEYSDRREDVLRIVDMVEEQIDSENIGYDLFIFKK